MRRRYQSQNECSAKKSKLVRVKLTGRSGNIYAHPVNYMAHPTGQMHNRMPGLIVICHGWRRNPAEEIALETCSRVLVKCDGVNPARLSSDTRFLFSSRRVLPRRAVDLASFEWAAIAGPAPVAFLMSPLFCWSAFLLAEPENNFPRNPILNLIIGRFSGLRSACCNCASATLFRIATGLMEGEAAKQHRNKHGPTVRSSAHPPNSKSLKLFRLQADWQDKCGYWHGFYSVLHKQLPKDPGTLRDGGDSKCSQRIHSSILCSPIKRTPAVDLVKSSRPSRNSSPGSKACGMPIDERRNRGELRQTRATDLAARNGVARQQTRDSYIRLARAFKLTTGNPPPPLDLRRR